MEARLQPKTRENITACGLILFEAFSSRQTRLWSLKGPTPGLSANRKLSPECAARTSIAAAKQRSIALRGR
jgi:hypothetical protein